MEQLLNQGDSSRIAAEIIDAAQRVAFESMRSSVIFHPRIYQDGDQFCCLLGENLQEGIASFGHTPDEAAREFDTFWREGK